MEVECANSKVVIMWQNIVLILNVTAFSLHEISGVGLPVCEYFHVIAFHVVRISPVPRKDKNGRTNLEMNLISKLHFYFWVTLFFFPFPIPDGNQAVCVRNCLELYGFHLPETNFIFFNFFFWREKLQATTKTKTPSSSFSQSFPSFLSSLSLFHFFSLSFTYFLGFSKQSERGKE